MNTGDKVVCINARFHPQVAKLYTALPIDGKTYVIRDVRIGIKPGSREGAISLLLVGLVNPKADSRAALERGFDSNRFRPANEVESAIKKAQDNYAAAFTVK